MGLSLELTYDASKQDATFLVPDPAATVVASAGNLKVWIGDNLFSIVPPDVRLSVPQVTVHNAIWTCFNRLREIVDPGGFPNAQAQTSAFGQPGAATSSFVTEQGAGSPAVTEDDVMLIYEQTFGRNGGRPFSSQIFQGKVEELWMIVVETSKFG